MRSCLIWQTTVWHFSWNNISVSQFVLYSHTPKTVLRRISLLLGGDLWLFSDVIDSDDRFSDNDNISRSSFYLTKWKSDLCWFKAGRESSRQRFFLMVSAHAEMNSNAQGGISFTYAKHQQEPQDAQWTCPF